MSELREVAWLALKLGVTGFGGPAAHIAMLHDEVVNRRKWLDEKHFLDLLGATNLIPGPNSTEMLIHVGYVRAGWPGLIVGGVGFILPALLLVLGLAWAYVRYGTTPAAAWLLYGIKPVVVVIVAHALWTMGRKVIKKGGEIAAAILILLLYLLTPIGEIPLLLMVGLIFALWQNRTQLPGLKTMIWPFFTLSPLPLVPLASSQLITLFLIFLKIGSVLYGSGYVLLAFLRADFVENLHWLTNQQLIDAVAVGQVTPGPVFTAATFIGYVLGGVPGALLATVGIFLPAFIFVAISSPLIPRIQHSPWARGFLDGVNLASLVLMAAVTGQLGVTAFVDKYVVLLALVTGILLFRFKVNTTWLIGLGAAAGYLSTFLGVG
ncbi:MAG: chromate efflux transporter [Chloroflexi bacterium]|nr:chromate efflux transporter [Chloroflexota bacterium]MBP8055631.1 chromate efflux transporter [Chloroflexota bacterium]